MLGRRLINTGAVACTTDTVQILDAGTTESIALYRFEDNADDTSNSTGKFGKGAVFNGSNSYIDLPANLAPVIRSAAAFSVSLWFQRNGNQPNSYGGRLIHILNDIYIVINLETNNTVKGLLVSSSSAYPETVTGVVPDNTWNHIVFTGDSNGVKLYLNGSLADSDTWDGTFMTYTNANYKFNRIGYSGSSVAYFKGKIDQVRFFNRALTSSEVTTLYNETTTTANTLQVLGDTSCVAAYTFEGNANDLDTTTPKNGTASNVIYDYSGTAVGSPSYVTGKFGKAASLSNSDTDYFTTNISPTILGNSFSLSAWVYVTQNSGSSDYYSIAGAYWNGSSGNQSWIFYINNGTLSFFSNLGATSGAGSINVTAGTVPLNQWNFVAFSVNDQKEISVYLNGVITTSAVSLSIRPNSINLTLGNLGPYNASRAMYGLLDQVRVFDKALSPGEFNTLYNETTTSAASATIDNPSTLAYYKMADATDETGSYDGTATNVDFNVQGKYGFAGKFTGSSKIVIPSDLGLRSSNLPLTFSLWINFDDLIGNGAFRAITGSESGNTSRGPFAVNLYGTSSGGIATSFERYYSGLQYYNTNYNTSAAVFNYIAGVWYHLCFVYTPVTDGTSTVSVYINGSQSGITNPTYTLDYGNNRASANNLVIGVYSSSSPSGWKGKLDQIRIFNKAISASEVTKLYNEIQCANTIATPESYFNTKLWTGDGNARSITGIGFDPDFVWIKKRANDTKSHRLFDSVRGANNVIYSDLNNDAATPTNELTAFVSGGFSLGNASAVNDAASDTYVSWNWKSGGITHKAASFPGNASIPTSGYLGSNWNSVPFSISFWAKSNSANDLFAMGTGNATGWAISFRNTSPRYVYMISGNNCAITYTVGEWKHFVYTFDGSNSIKGYGNSILEDTRTPHSSFGSTSPITIGQYGLAGNNFNGEIAQVRLFNKELSQNEINTVYAETASTLNTLEILGDTPNSCVATWPLGTNADDLSGNYSGTSSTNVTFGVPGFLMRNTNGTIQSTVSASQESGFSIVKYTGNGTAGSTVGHGLNTVPSLIIWKNLDATSNWLVYSPLIGNDSQWLYLNLGNQAQSSGSTNEYPTNKVDPTSSVVTVNGSGSSNNINIDGEKTIMYCFANVDGYQRIGSYVGTGTPENFIYTGFEPAWVLIKNLSTGSKNWVIVDNKRDNADEWLYADSNSNAYDDANTYTKFYANGFSVANNGSYVNTSGDSYIFLAIGANPDTTAPTKANSFNTKLFTPTTSSSALPVTGFGFKPDLVWAKYRGTGSGALTQSHYWIDSVRGINSRVFSNSTSAESTSSYVQSFDLDGITYINNLFNRTGTDSCVAWGWKALDHDRNLATINNDGSIKSLVSSNQNAGFSIVKYFGNTTAGATVAHGLSAKPEWIFIKNLDQSVAWMAYDTNINSVGYLSLNDDFQTGRLAWAFNSTAPTTKTVTLGYNGGTAVNSGDNFIMYLWHSVAGHSKIGSYTISSSSDRVITSLGFTPSWVMIKRTDALGNWVIFDSARGDDNDFLYANTSAAEGTTGFTFTLDTDGFTVGSSSWIGATGGTYIYMAFK